MHFLELFKKKVTENQTTVSFSLADWIATTIYWMLINNANMSSPAYSPSKSKV